MKILKNVILLVFLATIIFSCKQEAAMEEYQANDTLLTDQALPAEDVVYTDTEQDESKKNNKELKASESETELNYSDQEYEEESNEEESNEEERTMTCQYCDDNFIQKKVIVSVMGRSYETWTGGTNHCDPNWSSSDLSNANWSGKSKYCSRKCACEAGED
jgi:hypothetical protein